MCAQYIALFEGKRDVPEGSHDECAELIDKVLLQRELQSLGLSTPAGTLWSDPLVRELQWRIMSEGREMMSTQLVLAVEKSLSEAHTSLLEGTLLRYKHGIRSLYVSALHQMKPSRQADLKELHHRYGELIYAVSEQDWSTAKDTLLLLSTLLVSVRMLRKSTRLRKDLKKRVSSEAPAAHQRAVQRLDAIWQKVGKKPPAKCSIPVLVVDGATDTSLTVALTVPGPVKQPLSETKQSPSEITSMVVKVRRTGVDNPESAAWLETPVSQVLWQNKAENETFTWVLESLEAGTSYDIKVFARGSDEDCFRAKGGDSNPASLETLTVTSAEELRAFNDQLGEHLKETPRNVAGLLEVLRAINTKHVTLVMLKNNGENHPIVHSTKSSLRGVIRLSKPTTAPSESAAMGGAPEPTQTKPSAAEVEVSEMAERVWKRLRAYGKDPPESFTPVVVSKGEDRIDLALIVPRTKGVLSAFELAIKLSTTKDYRETAWKMLPEADWKGKPAGMEFTFVVSTVGQQQLQPGTTYDVAVRGKSDEAWTAGTKQELPGIKTVAARAPILEADLKAACTELRGLLDNNQVLLFSASSIETVKRIFELLKCSIVPVALMKRVPIMKRAVRDVAKSGRSRFGDEETATEVLDTAAELEAYWESTIKKPPSAPQLVAVFTDRTIILSVTIPDASTEITHFEVQITHVNSDEKKMVHPIAQTVWAQAAGQFEYSFSDGSFQSGADYEVKVRAHGSEELCWKKQGSWSKGVVATCNIQHEDGDDQMIVAEDTAVTTTKDASVAFLETIRIVAAGLDTDESVDISAGVQVIKEQLTQFEVFGSQWTVKLLKETSIRSRLRHLIRIDLTSQDDAELQGLVDRAVKLEAGWKKLIKSPPEQIKTTPTLGGVSQHSLTLSVNVPAASTAITAYEVKVVTLAEDALKNASRWIPEQDWKGKQTGDPIEWVLDGLEASTKYSISVRAYGTEEECFVQAGYNWSKAAELSTEQADGEVAPGLAVDDVQVEYNEADDDGEYDGSVGKDSVVQFAGYAAIGEQSPSNVSSPSSKAVARLTTSLKIAATHVYKKHYTTEEHANSQASGLCAAIRKAQLVRLVADAATDSEFTPTLLGAMEIAMLFIGGGKHPSSGGNERPSSEDKTTSSEHFVSFVEDALKLTLEYPAVQQCANAIKNMYSSDESQIQKVFEAAYDLDHCYGLPIYSDHVANHASHIDTDALTALMLQAKDAIFATGGPKLATPGTADAKISAMCSGHPTHCLAVVKKAHRIRGQVQKKLSASFPNLEDFQKRILTKAVDNSVSQIALKVPLDPAPGDKGAWLSTQVSGCPSEWVDEQVVIAKNSVLKVMTSDEKQAELCGKDKAKSLMLEVFSKCEQDQMNKDEPEDNEALELVAQKLILSNKGVVEGKPSKAWSELVTSNFRHSDWKKEWLPGHKDFNKHAQEMMREHNVPDHPFVSIPAGDKPSVQPYQQVVSYLAHPRSYTLNQKTGPMSQSDPSQRMLVVHRTGAGKTCSMIRVADNYFKDKRPKVLLFPSPAVCSNFYMELLNHRFPNKYADYLQREGKLDDVRSSLELKRGGLLCGRVRKEYLDDPLRPSAPLRAFSYTQAGGRQVIGERRRINAVFKCPDGYAGDWCFGSAGHENSGRSEDGYEEYQSDGNPFSNKIVLMDEFHNLINPSPEIRKSPTRSLMLQMLREMLRTAKNSVIIGFTGTPLVGEDGTAKDLLDIIKGAGNEGLSNEGYVSYFMGSPSPVFPIVVPPVNAISEVLMRKVQLENLSDKHGNLREYLKMTDETKALRRCSLGQHFAGAGSMKTFDLLTGGEGKILRSVYAATGSNDPATGKPHRDPRFGYCPERVRGYASKLSAVCDDVSLYGGKTLVLVHSQHGFKLMLRLLDARFPNDVLGYVGCNPSQVVNWDDEIKELIGDKHDEKEKAKGCCGCNICRYNNQKRNLEGEEHRIMVADARFCSEGCVQHTIRQVLSFF